jgi:hypothetical protein
MRRAALLRRAGTVPNTGVRYGPGSAAHHFVLRSVRGTCSPLSLAVHQHEIFAKPRVPLVPLQLTKTARVIRHGIFELEEMHMKKTAIALATVAALGAASVAAPAPAEARGIGPGLAFGLAAGAIGAGIAASTYPYYGPGYGYYGPRYYRPAYYGGPYAYYGGGPRYYRHRYWRHRHYW